MQAKLHKLRRGDPRQAGVRQPSTALYAGRTPFHGELHDHADTGGTSDGKRFISDDPLDYLFADETGLEVFYVTKTDTRTLNNYTLWTDLLAAGKRLVFCVSDFHSSQLDPTHTYRVKLLSSTGVVYEQVIDPYTPFYYSMDADASADFYRVEVYDETTGVLTAIGNPIWNDK